MKNIGKRLKFVLFAVVVTGSLGFGAVQAVGGGDPDTGCPNKPGCRYGGFANGCCMLP